MINFNGASASGDAGVPDGNGWTSWAARRLTTTMRWAGRTPWIRRTSGPSRLPRTWGGTRNGTIVHWPKGIKGKAEIRSQFHHVIDVAPTILEVAGLPQPLFVNGVQQHPIEGVSMAYSFNDAKAAEQHETQYFEMFGNRGIYHKGWTAVTRHKTPWLTHGRGNPAGLRRRSSGNSTTPPKTGARRTTWQSRCQKSCMSYNACG